MAGAVIAELIFSSLKEHASDDEQKTKLKEATKWVQRGLGAHLTIGLWAHNPNLLIMYLALNGFLMI